MVKLNITVVGAGVHGKRMLGKYNKFNEVLIKAVVDPNCLRQDIISNVPLLASADDWKNNFGKPSQNDVFDLCVHQNILIGILEDFVSIGAKNIILPKPVALTKKELEKIKKIIRQHSLKVLVGSQWHYADIVRKAADFIRQNKGKISEVNIVFTRDFEGQRKKYFTAANAFLPHIIQILSDVGLIVKNTHFVLESFSESDIKIKCDGKIKLNIETSIATDKEKELLNIFTIGKDKPVFIADFSSVASSHGLVKYPKVAFNGKENEIREDVLEMMIKSAVNYFSGDKKDEYALTFNKYLPVAETLVDIVEQAEKTIVVIGGGIFGILSALEIAKRGYSVVIIEKESEVCSGASLVNQCRVHMGYHYPRDTKTARDTARAEASFKKFFSQAINRDIYNHYLIAKEKSLTSPKKFLSFCKKLHLPYKEIWPPKTKFVDNKVALSLRVPESIFDAYTIQKILLEKIAKAHNISVLTNTEVTAIKHFKKGFEVTFKSSGNVQTLQCAAVVNATYSNVNYINNLIGLANSDYQYELCEEMVVKTPWQKEGWAIMDGPFFSIMPFGFSKNHIFYDVELSVLERVVGKFPDFKFTKDYYNDENRVKERFKGYKKRWSSYIKEMDECKYVSSMYATRIVLPNKEKTDARPSIVRELAPGFWMLFSGKITASIPCSIQIGSQVDDFMKKKHK